MLDTYRSVETPEGVELKIAVAGPVARAYAWLIDAGYRLGILLAASALLGLLGQFGTGALLVVAFLVEWFYPVWFEVRRGGQTPGKKSLGIAVLHDDGTAVGWSASMLRNLLRFADFLPFFYGIGLGSMLCQRDFKRLGDLAAGTIVAYRSTLKKQSKLADAPPLPPQIPLSQPEQRAVISFAEREPTWSDERAAELAALTRPLTGAPNGQASAAALMGLANWLVGRRSA